MAEKKDKAPPKANVKVVAAGHYYKGSLLNKGDEVFIEPEHIQRMLSNKVVEKMGSK